MTLRLIEGGRSSGDAPGLLIHGASQVATLAGGIRRGDAQGDLALLDAAAVGGPGAAEAPVVATWDGRVVAVGPRDQVEAGLERNGMPLARFARLDADGGVVTPGLVDPHTHLLFAGSREGELVLRQRGAGYLAILAAGGGILSTVAATRLASEEDLAAHGRRWLDEMLRHGVTSVEAKSGYGLDLPTELRLLAVAHALGKEGPVDVLPTFLGAHAVPPEYRARPEGTEAYVRSVIEEQLPGVAAQGRALSCDVFCEEGVFTADQSRRILTAAAGYGLAVRLHADELAPSGGAELAAELGAECEVRNVLRRCDAWPRIEDDMNRVALPPRELCAHAAAEIEPVLLAIVGRLIHADENETREFEPRRRDQIDCAILLALESADLRGARQQSLRRLVDRLGDRSELRPLLRKQRDDAVRGRIEWNEGNCGLIAHVRLLRVWPRAVGQD